MKKYFLHIAIIILFALPASSMAGIVKERNIKIAEVTNIDLCKSNNSKLFTFEVDIEDVKLDDKFIGYELIIAYDSNKVELLNVLSANSLTGKLVVNPDYLSMRKFTGTNGSKIAEISAFKLGKQFVTGANHLVAVQGMYKSMIADTTAIKIEAIYFMGDSSFLNQKLNYVDGELIAYHKKRTDVFYSLASSRNIDTNKLDEFQIKISSNISKTNIKNITLEIVNSNIEFIKVNDIISINENFIIDTVKKNKAGNYIIDAHYINDVYDNDIFSIHCQNLSSVTASASVSIHPIYENECVNTNYAETQVEYTPPIAVAAIKDELLAFINNGYLNLSSGEEIEKIQLLNLFGKVVLESEIYDENYKINISALNNGFYILKLQINNKIEIKKLLINN